MGRSPCCSKEGLNRGAWTAHEDKILTEYIKIHGEGRWRNLPKKAGLKRCGKSCRLRWLNYLRPDIKRGNISPDEEELIIRLHKLLGNRWSLIAGRLPGRTDNEIKNYWNTNLGKKVQGQLPKSGSPSPCRPVSVRPNERNDTKKVIKNTQLPRINDQPSNSPSARTDSLHVIRTKATKCTKVFVDPNPYVTKQSPGEAEEVAGALIVETNNLTIDPLDSNTNCENGLVLFPGVEGNPISSDFMMDFDTEEFYFDSEEFCFSELLNKNFSDICDFSNDNSNEIDISPSSKEVPLEFSDELLRDWAGISNSYEESNVATNLPPLLDS